MKKELDILQAFLPRLTASDSVPVGPGDDCAAIDTGDGRVLLAAVDQLVGDVHYFREKTSPAAAGAKLLKRNLSDIAAMGGVPRWALLAMAAGGRSTEWLLEFAGGVADAADAYGVNLCGGDIASLPSACTGEVSSLTILGTAGADRIVRRNGASAGDAVYVTGCLGNSLASGHHLDFEPRLAEGRVLAGQGIASAMLDISDGLLLDASRIADASGVCMELDISALPLRAGADCRMALTDGEDYELLFTVPERMEKVLKSIWTPELSPVHCIGRVKKPDGGALIRDTAGNDLLKGHRGGYEH